jgi:hypothetical protein
MIFDGSKSEAGSLAQEILHCEGFSLSPCGRGKEPMKSAEG